MCGIAGFTNINSSNDHLKSIIEKMLSVIAYRGPDDEGIAINPWLTFGHRRLSIIDPHGGKQPCVDTHGNILVFNGEIYGYKEISRKLKQQNIQLRYQSDTEVLFWLLNTKGIEKTLEMVDGMFAFAYYSKALNKLFLARDRFGEKPLFYSYKEQQLIYASEIKAMRQHPMLEDTTLDPEQISSYLTLEYLPGAMSGFMSIEKLLPGHWLCYDLDKKDIRVQQYSRVDLTTTKEQVGEQEKLERLKQLVSESVKQRLIADAPVGVFLSGGLDSSIIASLAREHSNKINSYTIKMPGLAFDESPYAYSCAKKLDLEHTTIELCDRDILDTFDQIVENLDEPLADSSLIPTALLCRYTSQHVKVAIGGDGADELFAGYPNFQAQHLAPIMSYMPAVLGGMFRQLLGYLPVSEKYMSPAFKFKQLSYGFGLPVEQQSAAWMSSWFKEDQKKLWRNEYRGNINKGMNDLLKDLKCKSNTAHRVDQLLYTFTHTYLPDNILVKMDRASMYSSLEVRSPFLDKNLSEYVYSLPYRDKIRFFNGKYLLKKLAKDYLPDEIIKRKKHGFGFPISSYIRTHLKERVADILLDKNNPVMDWFERDKIEQYWKEHQSLQRDHGKKLWALFVLMSVARN